MNVKELIEHLRCFGEKHRVIVQDRDIENAKDITSVEFDGRNCVIKAEDDCWKVRM